MRVRRISSLYRSIVPWNPATGWALSTSCSVFVSASFAHGVTAGFRGAVAVFLAWAITRELAPKRGIASMLAPFAGVAFAIPGDTDLLACVGVLLAARVASRSIGDPPTPIDRIALVPIAGWLATRPVGLPVALILAAVVFVQDHDRRLRFTGALMLVAALAVGSTEGTLTARGGWEDPALAAQALMALAAGCAIVLLAWPLPRLLRTRDDRRRGPLHGARIRVARVVTIAAVAAAVVWVGTSGVFELSSASAAIVAAALGGAGARAARTPDTD
ncbi:MAG: hypothetical protein JWM86_1289 [Thermoleophilia bacterium]|nr:hypothetical protein [Thermoleophilia bacterium]